MQKFPEGGLCHVSGRPYDVFRWKAGSGARYKKTVICQDLAKLKDVCQVCMLDLKYNIPIQVREKLMKIPQTLLFKSIIGREMSISTHPNRNNLNSNNLRHENNLSNNLLMNIVGVKPYYERNQARVCSFFNKGKCNRGNECPFRHSVPPLGQTKQNYHDRYNGIEDPVAHKMLARAAHLSVLLPPVDLGNTTLFIGNITPDIAAQCLRNKLYHYGVLQPYPT
jgi:pre-mRNA-splicing factor RBM22/SLT11